MAGGVAAGGQLTTTTEVENFPGFPDGLGGPELMDRMRQQSINCGTTIETETITEVDLSKRPFTVTSESGKVVEAETLILSTGATAKRLGIKGEEVFWQKGMSACAVCDGALPIFRDKVLVVVGGGDSAMEEATFLTKFASKVLLVHRRDSFRASKSMQKRVLENTKIEVHWNSAVIEAKGENLMNSVIIQNLETKAEVEHQANGLFYAIGHTPNTAFLKGQLELDEAGYVLTKPGTTETSVPGVFASGDVQDAKYRQAVTSAGTGCMAALEAEAFLTESE
jgi:thioredoxin reductase (NADPH)